MSAPTWIISGATSVIAQEFARLAAQAGHALILIGRDSEQLAIIMADIRLRYRVDCEVINIDFSQDISPLMTLLHNKKETVNLFLAHSLMVGNDKLNNQTINELIKINIISTTQLIHAYLNREQNAHRLVFLSSVAACKGRTKNSLYGASKAAVEVYLQGLQQAASNNQHITIARLGFIDTKSTYGEPGIFYAASPKTCARACWKASIANKRLIYYPFFWRYIMGIITRLPFFIYKKMAGV